MNESKILTTTLEEVEDFDLIETTGVDIDSGSGKPPGDFLTPASIITGVIAVVLALVIFFGLVIRKKEPNSGFAKWWKEFLNFRKIWIAGLMKFVYLLGALLTIGAGIVMIIYGFWWGKEQGIMLLVGLGVIILGNIVLRLSFEMTMLMVGLWENTSDIRGAIVGARQRVEEKRAAQAATKPESKKEE